MENLLENLKDRPNLFNIPFKTAEFISQGLLLLL